MATIIRRSHVVESVEYNHGFEWLDRPGAGFAFPCDVAGKVNVEKLNPAAAENYRKCVSGEFKVRDQGVETYHHSYREPAILKCDCGAEVCLDGFTNTCECGTDYNSAGQRLAPRSQWGEETGETAADLDVNIDRALD